MKTMKKKRRKRRRKKKRKRKATTREALMASMRTMVLQQLNRPRRRQPISRKQEQIGKLIKSRRNNPRRLRRMQTW
jgi:hypothetical protein